MIRNHLGNSKYFLIEDCNLNIVKENMSNQLKMELDENNVIKAVSKFMESTGNYMNPRNLEDVFGFAYITMDNCAILTLDTNEYIFVDNEHYMSMAAEGKNKSVYVYCENHDDGTGYWIKIK